MMRVAILLLAAAAVAALGQNWQEITVDGFTLRWATVAGDNLAVELEGPSTGWIAVGFDPTQMMLNSNIIIGYVESGTPYLRDDFGFQTTSHRADTLLGGTEDLTIDGGSEGSGVTEIQFTIPLNSGDTYDRPLVIGNTYPVIFARSSNGMDDFSAPHVATASSSITIESLALEPYTWAAIKKI